VGDGANRTRGFSDEAISFLPRSLSKRFILAEAIGKIEAPQLDRAAAVGTRVLLTHGRTHFIVDGAVPFIAAKLGGHAALTLADFLLSSVNECPEYGC
jgi:hypothetical protein